MRNRTCTPLGHDRAAATGAAMRRSGLPSAANAAQSVSALRNPLFAALIVVVGVLGAASQAWSEGSRSLFPSGYADARAPMDLQDNATTATIARNRQFIYVYAEAGEYLLLGSSNRVGGGRGNISVYNPQSFGTPGVETRPGTADFSCNVAPALTEGFDGVTPPALPAGWSTTGSTVAGNQWVTSAGTTQAGANKANLLTPGDSRDKRLTSPAFNVGGLPASLSFYRSLDLEATFDGMVLEISINGGAFQDALAPAGSSFATGGYTGPLPANNALGARQAWQADTSGYEETIYNLPPSVSVGDTVQFRWRVGTDPSVNSPFFRIDSVSFTTGSGLGRIQTRVQELAGPRSANGVNGGTNTWVPCSYQAPATGIYGVQFSGAAGAPTGNTNVTNINTDPQVLANYASAWEVQVRANATTTTDINGRVFTYAWMGRTSSTSPANGITHTLYYITSDGYRYSQTLKDISPITYALWANRAGFFNSSNGIPAGPLYKDVRGDNINITTLLPTAANITAQVPQFPVFFADVSDSGPNDANVEQVLAALGIPNTPPSPELNSVSFVGTVSGNQTAQSTGGTFTFSTVNTLTYQIVISRDGVNFDPANPLNKVLTGTAFTGTHNVPWDGRANDNSDFPASATPYPYRIEGRNGEIHLPLADNEGMPNGGFRIERLNGPDVGTAAARTVFYDDRGYITTNNTAVGALNGHLCGVGNLTPQPSPNVNLLGVDSATTYRVYTGTADSNSDCASGATIAFGSAKVLETWTLVSTPVTQQELIVVPALTGRALRVVKTGPAGPIDVNTATSATYRITVTNEGDTATNADIFVTDDLLSGLSYVSETNNINGNWTCNNVPPRVTCTRLNSGGALAAGASTSFDLTVNIAALTVSADNTARVHGGGDPGCSVPDDPVTNAGRCTSTVLVGTVPVTLSYVKPTVVNGQLQVEFTTLAEAGTAGFRILAGNGATGQRSTLSSVLPSKGSSLAPQHYASLSPYNGESAVWVEEIVSDGSSTIYGPYAIGQSVGERVAGDLIDWPQIQSQLDSFNAAQLTAIRGRGTGASLEAEIALSTSGLARVSFENLLAQGIDWSGVDPSRIEITRGDVVVDSRYSGPPQVGAGSSFAFLGEAVSDSLYTRTAVYRMRVRADSAPSMLAVWANPSDLAPVTKVRDWVVHAPNREYDLSARDEDPYSAFRLFRGSNSTVSRVENFNLPNLELTTGVGEGGDPGVTDRVEIDLWSDFDMPHSVRLVLNNTEISRLRFVGRGARTVGVDVTPGLLLNGANSLRMELLADTGQELDSVNLEEIRVNYTRRLVADSNALAFSLPDDLVVNEPDDNLFGDGFGDARGPACQPMSACTAYQITGLTSPDVMVLRQRAGQIAEMTGALITGAGNAFELAFASHAQPGDRYWIEPRTGRVATSVTPALPVADPLIGGPADYLIVSHGSLIAGLAPFIVARQAEGLTVRTVDVRDLYYFYGRGEADPAAIQLAIQDAAQRLGTSYVLLVGGDTRDYLNFGGSNSVSFIPTYYRQVGPIVTFAPTDVPFADLDDNGSMDLAIGRWPVRTLAELSMVVDKTLAYAQADHGGKTVMVSDRNQEPVNFGTQLRLVPDGLGAPWVGSSIALQDYPSAGAGGTTTARNDLVSAINAGQSLMVFMGHGAPLAWTQEGLITSQLLINGMFSNPTRPTVTWAVGCYGTYFTQPTYNSVSHGLLTRTPTGAAAVFGASTLTEIAHDVAWVNALSYQIRGERLGDSIRSVQNRMVQSGDSYKDIWMGVSLMGDPALRLRETR
jgi:uncharacterized repeat protein (TIGR01451 family)